MTPTTQHVLPPDTQAVVYAENQTAYRPLPALRTPRGLVLTQWMPTDAERALIAAGAPLTLCILTFNAPLQPLMLDVGPVDIAEF
jgi:hypothetical protein